MPSSVSLENPTEAAHQPPTRRRARAMSPEQRRDDIIAATLPLLKEHGANVTTSQIAHAAGIAEGTIFRVFPDKRTLLLAALRAAMSASEEVARIGDISLATPLADRLEAGISAVGDYQDRLWSLMRTLQESGWQPNHKEMSDEENHPLREMQRVGGAIAALFEPEAQSLRLQPRSAARLLLGLAFTNRMGEHGMGEPSATPAQLVDWFLYGALKTDV
jgi:AcrR family transcriptional regulator